MTDKAELRVNLLNGLHDAADVKANAVCQELGIDREELELWIQTHSHDELLRVLEGLDK